MFKKVIFATSTALLIVSAPIAGAVPENSSTIQAASIDPARLAAAQKTVGKLIPPGTYKRMMKDVMDKMANGMIEQMMGMDAATVAGMAGAKADSGEVDAVKGKTIGELTAQKDPHFKERMDIMMKVMFTEMGAIMTDMEPAIRNALSNTYARKYNVKQLDDMNAFFGTPSGAAFADNFMATFTDKEMIDASMAMMPKIMEAMPVIMKKVEAATAHLPPLQKAAQEIGDDAISFEFLDDAPECAKDDDLTDCSPQDKTKADSVKTAAIAKAADAIENDPNAGESGNEGWYAEENWTPAQRKTIKMLSDKYLAASDKSTAAFTAYEIEEKKAIDAARIKLKQNMELEIITGPRYPAPEGELPADMPPPPSLITP